MPGSGAATLDFGVFPGASDTSLAISGQAAIVPGSLVEAWLLPGVTADHSTDEHIVDPPRIVAANISSGVGFTIYGTARDGPDGNFANKNANTGLVYGQWSVAWVWN